MFIVDLLLGGQRLVKHTIIHNTNGDLVLLLMFFLLFFASAKCCFCGFSWGSPALVDLVVE